jgi:gliding motility-associated lipoprotein GldD
LLRDAQTLTYKHVIKADDILEQPYLNLIKVYGMFYQVVMQRLIHSFMPLTVLFIQVLFYFYAKPNFDSIMPATSYIKK